MHLSSFFSKDVVFAVPLILSKICDNGASLTVLLYSAEGGRGSVSDGLRVVLYQQANISKECLKCTNTTKIGTKLRLRGSSY